MKIELYHFVPFIVGFVPVALWPSIIIPKDAWNHRWHQRFRGPKPEDSNWSDDKFCDSDLEAFWKELKHKAKHSVDWKVVIALPFVGGTAVTVAWYVIYLLMWVVR